VSPQIARNGHETRKRALVWQWAKTFLHPLARVAALEEHDIQLGGEPPSEPAEAGAPGKKEEKL